MSRMSEGGTMHPKDPAWAELAPEEQERRYRDAERAADAALQQLMQINDKYRAEVEAAHAAYTEAEDRLEELRRERYPEIYATLDGENA